MTKRLMPLAPLVSLVLFTACASSGAASSSSAAAAAAGGDDRRAAAKAQLGELAGKVASFDSNVGRCPVSFEEMMQPPQGDPVITSIPNDPWGHPVALMPKTAETDGAVVSGGPDGSLMTDDDVSVKVYCSGG